MILAVTCRKCGQVVNVEYELNDIITEKFLRSTFVCNGCGNKPRFWKKPVSKQTPAPLPYKD